MYGQSHHLILSCKECLRGFQKYTDYSIYINQSKHRRLNWVFIVGSKEENFQFPILVIQGTTIGRH